MTSRFPRAARVVVLIIFVSAVGRGAALAQTLTFTAPTAATTWAAGSTQTITWRISGGTPAMGTALIRLSYKTSADPSWRPIGEIAAFRQGFSWSVPPSLDGRVTLRADWLLGVPVTFMSREFRVTASPAGRLATERRAGCDYALDSVGFADGQPLTAGFLYSPDISNPARLLTRVRWNRVDPPRGIQCRVTLAVLDRGGTMLQPGLRVPDPNSDGVSEVPVVFNIPARLATGSDYAFRMRILSSDPTCDTNVSNNEDTFRVRLLRMSGNDLVVRITGMQVVRWGGVPPYALRVHYEVMNVTGDEVLYNVKVDVEGVRDRPTDAYHRTIDVLPPKRWVQRTEDVGAFDTPAGAETFRRVTAKVDPANEIRELREDNNEDSKPVRIK